MSHSQLSGRLNGIHYPSHCPSNWPDLSSKVKNNLENFFSLTWIRKPKACHSLPGQWWQNRLEKGKKTKRSAFL